MWENEPKLKETTVDYFEFRHQQSIEGDTRDNSESVNQDARIILASLISSLQDARIILASLISSLQVARYDCLPHHFFLDVSTSSVSRKN